MAEGDRSAYDTLVDNVRVAMSGDVREVAVAVEYRMARLAEEERFEEAAVWRERLGHLVEASVRTHRLAMLAGTPELVAAVPTPDQGWDIHVVRYGRLAAAGHAPAGAAPRSIVDALVATAEHVEPAAAPKPAGLSEEALELLRWLESDGVRLVRSDRPLALPLNCGGSLVTRLGAVRRAAQRAAAGDDYRTVADASRPRGPVDARPVSRILSA